MSNSKKIDKYIQLLQLKARLAEVNEFKAVVGNTNYYANRRRVLAQAIENLVLELLGVQVERPSTRKVVIEIEREEERPEMDNFDFGQMDISVEKALVNEERFDAYNQVARAFGIKIPKDMSNVDQYLVTTIQGLLR